jgi:hypothetical protein
MLLKSNLKYKFLFFLNRFIFLFLIFYFYAVPLFSSENVYWSNSKNGPYSVEEAKSQFGNRILDPIEGIWFDDGLGTLSIIKDEDQNRFKMFIIDIPAPNKQFNQTWEATFYKNQRGYNFFSRVWYSYPGSSKKIYKTQSGSAIISIAINEMIMDYERRSDSGREMDHSLKKIWPPDTLAYNKNILSSNKLNYVPKISGFNPNKYKYNSVTDYKGTKGNKRTCHEFRWEKDYYYTCVDDLSKKITSYSFDDGSGPLLRYQVYEDGSFVFASFEMNRNSNDIQTGGWKRKNGTILYGAYNYSSKKWIAYESNKNFKSNTGLSSLEAGQIVQNGKYFYKKGIEVKKNNEFLLRHHNININKTEYKRENPTAKSNNKSVKKKYYQEKSYKDYWWVVVLIGVVTFFVYMHTTKNINPKKKKAAIKTKIKQTKATSNVANNINILLRFFRGELSLAVSYWLWLGGVGVVMTLALTLMEKNRASDELVGISSLFFLAVYIYLYIGTWRSAENYKTEKKKQKLGYGWATTAQVLMIIGIIRFFVELFKELSK